MSLEMIKRNERLEGIFNRTAKKFDSIGPKYFSYLGRKLVEYTKINEGSTLLDVACGKGASLFPAINCVGENGQVIGIDFSEEMVKETQSLIVAQGLHKVKVIQMDAENLNFTNKSFDYVLCGLSVSFFSDSLKAIDEMYRVLKTGGRIGLSTWNMRQKKSVLGTAYSKVFPQEQPKKTSITAQMPDFGSVDGVKKILENAGFKSIEIFIEKKTFYYKDEEEWWNEQWTNASRGLFEHIESIGPSALNKFKEAALIEIKEYKDVQGIRFDAEVIFSFGYK